MHYFVLVGSEQRGPFSLEQLKRLEPAPDVFVWRQGLPSWAKARDLPEAGQLFIQEALVPPSQARSDSVINNLHAIWPGGPIVLTNPQLSFLGNFICFYYLVVAPILWILTHVVGIATKPWSMAGQSNPGLQLLLLLFETLASLALTAMLALGAWRMVQLDVTGVSWLRWSIVLGLLLTVVLVTASIVLTCQGVFQDFATERGEIKRDSFLESFTVPSRLGLIANCILQAFTLGDLGFSLVALVWLIWRAKRVPWARL